MVVSQIHRYLFIEVPLTATWAVRNELCTFYSGVPILHKHATWTEFARRAAAEEVSYFVFAAVRHPMDTLVSEYHKLLSDHKGTFSGTEIFGKHDFEEMDRRKFDFVTKQGRTFQEYFKEFHQKVYCGMVDLSADRLDYVIRYEHLQADFSALLELLGIDQIRPIPIVNKTQGRPRHWQEFYTPEIKNQAMTVFGPFMEKWNYSWPAGWGVVKPQRTLKFRYCIRNHLRYLYFNYVRYNDYSIASILRSLRAQF